MIGGEIGRWEIGGSGEPDASTFVTSPPALTSASTLSAAAVAFIPAGGSTYITAPAGLVSASMYGPPSVAYVEPVPWQPSAAPVGRVLSTAARAPNLSTRTR